MDLHVWKEHFREKLRGDPPGIVHARELTTRHQQQRQQQQLTSEVLFWPRVNLSDPRTQLYAWWLRAPPRRAWILHLSHATDARYVCSYKMPAANSVHFSVGLWIDRMRSQISSQSHRPFRDFSLRACSELAASLPRYNSRESRDRELFVAGECISDEVCFAIGLAELLLQRAVAKGIDRVAVILFVLATLE